MEERTLKISFEKAKEFYQKGGEFRILALYAFTEEELTKVELPKTWEEFCKSKPKIEDYYISDNSKIRHIKPNVDVIPDRIPNEDANLLPCKEAAEQHLALMQLHQLRDCYRQGWIPNYTNDLYKWCILKHKDKLSIDINFNRVTFLSFQSKEIAKEFLNNFRDLIKQAGDLI